MPRCQASMAQLAPRRSTCANRSHNGCGSQPDHQGEQPPMPMRQKRQPSVPEDGLVLENNVLAPTPKKRWSRVCLAPFSGPPSTNRFYRRIGGLFISNPNLWWCDLNRSPVNHSSMIATVVLIPLHLPNKQLPCPLLLMIRRVYPRHLSISAHIHKTYCCHLHVPIIHCPRFL